MSLKRIPNRITDDLSAAISVVSQAVSIVSTAASNALSVANAASNAASVVSASNAALSLAVSVLSQQVSVLSAVGPIMMLKNEDNIDLSAGRAVKNATSVGFTRADPDDVNRPVIGLVLDNIISVGETGRIQNRGMITLTSAQWDQRIGGIGGLSTSRQYFLDSVQGNYTESEIGLFPQAVGVALSPTTMIIGIENRRDVRLSVISAAATSADGHANAVSAALVTLSLNVSAISTTLSNEISARAASIQTLSAAVTSVDGRVTSGDAALSLRINSVISADISVVSAALAVLSLAVSALSTNVSTLSAKVVSVSAQIVSVEAHAVAASAAATSADGHANTVSAAVETLSAKVVSVSAQLVSIEAHAVAASAAVTSIDGRVNSVNTFISGISARSVGGVSTHGFQSVINALSNRISAVIAGATSVTSTEYSVRTTAGVSIRGFQSVFDALSNRISAGGGTASVTSNELSAVNAQLTSITPTFRALGGEATVSATAMTNISGMSLGVTVSGQYIFDAMLIYSAVTAQQCRFGLSFPPVVHTNGLIRTPFETENSSITRSTINAAPGWWRDGDSGLMVLSVSCPATPGIHGVLYNGTFLISNASGTIQLMCFASSGTGRIVILKGSYMRLSRIG